MPRRTGVEATKASRRLRQLELVRKAATMPACQFSPLDKLTVFSSSYQTNSDIWHVISSIPTLLRVSILDHQARGDLDGAWNDLVVMFRIAPPVVRRGTVRPGLRQPELRARRFESGHGLGG